jgi:hypothetical protein
MKSYPRLTSLCFFFGTLLLCTGVVLSFCFRGSTPLTMKPSPAALAVTEDFLDAVRAGNYQVLDRDTAVTPEEQKKMYGAICVADCFLMSTNAITLDGELVNVDNRGNRVSFLCFGPDKVIVVTGMNKVVSDVPSGLRRARDIAAPPNTLRLNRKTPCAVTGRCGNCQSPDCICAQTVITRRSAFKDRIIVVLVGEELGY